MSRLPTHLLIAATIKNAEAAGVYITVLRRGDADRGTFYIKVDNTMGGVKLYEQIYDGQKTQLQLHSEGAAADTAITRISNNDPDAWVIEVLDKQGRIWFDAAL